MKLSDQIAARSVQSVTAHKATFPKGWEPGIKFASEGIQEVTTGVLPTLEGEPDWREAVEAMGISIPDGYRVRLAEMRFDPVAWTRENPDQKYATTKPAWRYKFVIEPFFGLDTIDGIEVLNSLKRRGPSRRVTNAGEASLVINLNDTQIGKMDGGGTEATIERLDRYFDLVVDRAKDEKNIAGDLVILLGGDLVEGCSIYPNQSFQIDRDRRAQIRTMTGVVLNLLDRIAPQFPTVRVLAVPGNHGEHRLNGKRVNRHDNDDQLVAEAVATASERDPALQHVAFNIAYDEPAITAEIQGHNLALTHGSVYAKRAGSSPADKAYGWYKNMAGARDPVGSADILVGNHFHHEVMVNYGALLFIQNPAMDGGSKEFADYSGSDCPAGMATWIMSRGSRFTGYEVLR